MIEPLLHAERLLLHGQVDEAERIYAQTATADPHNAIAVVGLARVALERGDDRLAYSTACRALAIDSQNVAALRLEARLSEVLATRGEPVTRPAWIAGSKGSRQPTAMPPVERSQPVAHMPDARPNLPAEAERAAFARNPSMADHRARMQHSPPNRASRPPTASQPRAENAPAPRDENEPAPRRRSVIARLLGRR